MSPGEGFELHPAAAQDISDILEYIAADNPPAASHLRHDLLLAIESLVRFPLLGHRRPELTGAPLRFRNVGNYWIAYAPETRPLLITAVMDSRRSPRVLAAVLRGRT